MSCFSDIQGAQPSSLTPEEALGSRSKKRRGRKDHNRLWSQILLSDYLNPAQPQHTQYLVMGSSKMHKWLPALLSVEQRMQKSSSQQQTNIYCLLGCKMNDDTFFCIWGLLQQEQRCEGVHHDSNSLAEQEVISRAMPHCFRRAFIPHTTIWTLVHTEQLLKDCTAVPFPLKLAPIMSLSPPRQRKIPSKLDILVVWHDQELNAIHFLSSL